VAEVDANPNGDRTDDRFLSLDHFFILAFFILIFFIILVLFFVLWRFVYLDLLETNDVYRRKADLAIPVSKLYDMMDNGLTV
jgi:hypothetical protein